MKFYHATTSENSSKIISDFVIKAGCDGAVYLCDNAKDSCKFLAIRGIKKMVVFEVEIDEDSVEESFDHSEAFFHCKAFTHAGDIELDDNTMMYSYTVGGD